MKTLLLIISLVALSLSASQQTVYGPVNQMNDAVQIGDTLFIATGGGLASWNISSNSYSGIVAHNDYLPDVNLKSLCLTRDGSVWMGSAKGYLYRKSNRGYWSTFDQFASSGLSLERIVLFGDYLLIAHAQGLSVFDTKKEQIISNVTELGVNQGRVFDIKVVGDTLFATVEKEIVKFDSLSSKIVSFEFRTRSNWEKLPQVSTDNLLGLAYGSTGIIGYPRRAILFGDTLVTGELRGKQEYITQTVDGVKTEIAVRSPLSSVIRLDNGTVVTTTKDDHFYQNPLTGGGRDTIPGPTYGQYTLSLISRTGDLWSLPLMSWDFDQSLLWLYGITRKSGAKYSYFTPNNTEYFGGYNTGPVEALAESRNGSIWVGTDGANVKQWDASTQEWWKWIIDAPSKSLFRVQDEKNDYPWVVVRGIMEDSLAYMWFTPETVVKPQSVFGVVDPITMKFKYLFERGTSEMGTMTAGIRPEKMATDAQGTRYCIDPDNNRTLIINGSFNPLTDPLVQNQNWKEIEAGSAVKQVVSVPKSSSVLYASGKGVGIIRNDAVVTGGIRVDTLQYSEPWIRSYLKPVSSVAVEKVTVDYGGGYDSIVTTTFWASVADVGIGRFTVEEKIKNNVDSAFMLFNSGDPILFPKQSSIDFVTDATLALDKAKGELWVTSSSGIVRLDLGYEPETIAVDHSKSKVYPNPYSKSRHNNVVIDNLSINVYIDVYTISGNLVAHFDTQNNDNFKNSGEGKIFTWTPSKNLAPGTYLVATKDSEDNGMTEIKKLIIIP